MLKRNKIIDERQELQSLKNVKICWTVVIFLLAISILIQAIIFTSSPQHYMPELGILTVGCFLNIILDARQGNIYTKEMQNPKANLLLYITSALVASLVLGIGNYLKYGFPPIFILAIVIPMFVILLALMLLCDFIYRKAALGRLNKFNKTLEKDEDL
ncbi:DUF6773 family protein [Aminipila terrae]|uniref:Uncharacterized protein n=1 Tax=Aminipila terrae TaxID=2697030 RepID=A0A6P1MBP4_9FIRM|nr:DUF6773 family protein [Aminipila terrae]QHI72129.1 hypothetical protein Ami3637_06680 [Aminipila terrae]